MQIQAIILYNHAGDRRILPFELGQVNIITGRSRTGKSQLIPIVDYCLGSSSCKVARGPIRNTVAWYALLLDFGGTQMFVARKAPEAGAKTTNAAHLTEGANLKIPEHPPIQNSTAEEIEAAINARLGIAPNLNIPAESRSSPPLRANFRHALFYCFQGQTQIADPDTLFHRQGERGIELALRDTLPYFLGVVREDTLALQQRLRHLQRHLTLAKRSLAEVEELSGSGTDGFRKAFVLLGEARQLGLVPPDFNESLDEPDRLVALFRQIGEWQPGQPAQIDSRRLNALIEERENIREARTLLDENIQTLKRYALDAEGFVPVAREQALRLESIGFFSDQAHDPQVCPVCSQALDHSVPTVTELSRRLDDLNTHLDGVVRSQPDLRRQIEQMERDQLGLDDRSRALRDEIQALYDQNDALKRLRDEDHARLRMTGRISMWLDSVSTQSDVETLASDVERLTYQVEQLEAELSAARGQERLNRAMVAIGTQMTQWAKALALEPIDEDDQAFVDLDPVRMTLAISTLRERMGLSEIGSGENWLLYHLIAHFALHAQFVRTERPTPRFLFLDQPTQVYFPESTDESGVGADAGDLQGDWQAVQRLFHFIMDVTHGMNPHFQVIVSDHANLKDDSRFQQAVREVWRDERALIPQRWIDDWKALHPADEEDEESDASEGRAPI